MVDIKSWAMKTKFNVLAYSRQLRFYLQLATLQSFTTREKEAFIRSFTSRIGNRTNQLSSSASKYNQLILNTSSY